MPAPKPVLGYPSLTEAAVSLAAAGVPHAEIARRIERPVKWVDSMVSQGRMTHKRRSAELRARQVTLPPDVAQALAPHAAARGIDPAALALRIVETVAEEAMIDAVLDDAEED